MTARLFLGAGLALAAAVAAPAAAQDVGLYVGVSGGVTFPSSLDTAGAALPGDRVLGDGRVFGVNDDGSLNTDDVLRGTVVDGTVVPAGSEVAFDPDVSRGVFLNGALGYRHSSGLRGELELAIDTQSISDAGGRLALGDLDLSGEDVFVLFPTSRDRAGGQGFGVTVGSFLQQTRGSVGTTAVFANGYYDFLNSSDFTPYVGAGVGVGSTSVEIRPVAAGQSINLLDNSDSGVMYQVMGGVSYYFSDFTDVYAGVRYRDAGTVSVESDTLFSGTEYGFDVSRVMLEVGMRYTF